ncbi:MAG: tetratricopeptide repeat protein [Acidobacteria bacterium]|nr:tetratricopeptide repeat protein [Acidobacteriota bacterium]MBK8147131.1 tetratricopeptide repeat protein [Acidobacteriota bacterium]
MNKENILFGIIGLVAGLVIGFMFANSVNRGSSTTTAQNPLSGGMSQNANMPPGHPEISGNNPTAAQMENIPQVQEAIEKAKAEPGNYDAQMNAGKVYFQIRKYDSAIELIQRANKLKPEEVEPLVMLGNSYSETDKFEEAEKWYTSALAKKPNDVVVRMDLALTFVLREPANYERAIQEFNKALAVDPKHLQSLQNLTVTYIKKGDAANAKATLAKIEAIEPSNAAIGRLKEEVEKLGK